MFLSPTCQDMMGNYLLNLDQNHSKILICIGLKQHAIPNPATPSHAPVYPRTYLSCGVVQLRPQLDPDQLRPQPDPDPETPHPTPQGHKPKAHTCPASTPLYHHMPKTKHRKPKEGWTGQAQYREASPIRKRPPPLGPPLTPRDRPTVGS